jgi:F1F0 ATPase subunit 2
MTQTTGLLTALLGGLVLGIVHFGGLWITVRRLVTARHPALLGLGSFVLRITLVVGGVALLHAGDVLRLAAALVGILAVRTVAVRRARPTTAGVGRSV